MTFQCEASYRAVTKPQFLTPLSPDFSSFVTELEKIVMQFQ